MLGGRAWGNLYLTEKAGGKEFDEGDEEAAVVLADWAAVAIDNARVYGESQARRGGARARGARPRGDDRDRARGRQRDRAASACSS